MSLEMRIFRSKRSPVHLAVLLAVILALPVVSGCSKSKLAVGAMVPILENSKTVALASNDLRTFNSATPSNLFLLEGMIATDPDKVELRLSAAMLYFSYAFSLPADDEAYASLLYLKGLHHGKQVLFRNKAIAEVWDKPFDEFTPAIPSLDDNDMEALLWTVD
jgi:hypothetical protein